MGWTFSNQSKASLIRELSKPNRFDNWIIVKSTVIGNRHWFLSRHFENGEYLIGLDLLSKHGREYGYKTIDETMGPYYYDCPAGYLDYPTNDAKALEWRVICKTVQADKKKKKKAFKPGLQLTLNTGWVYTLICPAGTRKGWIVDRSDNTRWRMPFTQLNRAVIL